MAPRLLLPDLTDFPLHVCPGICNFAHLDHNLNTLRDLDTLLHQPVARYQSKTGLPLFPATTRTDTSRNKLIAYGTALTSRSRDADTEQNIIPKTSQRTPAPTLGSNTIDAPTSSGDALDQRRRDRSRYICTRLIKKARDDALGRDCN
ncbi:hypothetical protein LTR56_014560 [Elasticomyces elasticus]|nr:hypothetical protein LTR22_024996 [Elasticomyces elasticus]KAK3635684.1 hypothetical protein LTR56_014560 [Elasticomyces elasticus]KAK4916349.1 hypothetical protein LTR49_015583 [Elasticomyces elasticus]KAK5755821.1 hypothetical protein LTS12_014052 [Elasticomyces elasticus]